MEQSMPDRNRRYTVEEYLALDGVSDVKYEYWDGLLVPHGGWETRRQRPRSSAWPAGPPATATSRAT